MKNKFDIPFVKMQVSLPKELKKEIKIIAVYENIPMQEKILRYIKDGVVIDRQEKKVF
ncbi:MAG: hypothetical protein ABI597_07275 [Gammaproteobacteria bacterium]